MIPTVGIWLSLPSSVTYGLGRASMERIFRSKDAIGKLLDPNRAINVERVSWKAADMHLSAPFEKTSDGQP